MEKSEIHNGWQIREKGEEKGDIPQKNTTQIGSKSRRKRVRAIARTKGEGEVQRNKKRKMDRGGSLKIKAQITKKQWETQRMQEDPPFNTRRVAGTHETPPLRIKCGTKSQGSPTGRKPFIFHGRHDTS